MKHFGEDTWEFIRDDRFVQWVLFPDATNTAWWEQWMAAHPERIPVLEKARSMVLGLGRSAQPAAVDETLLEEVYAALDHHLLEERPAGQPIHSPMRRLLHYKWWGAAAAVIAGVVLVSIYLKTNNKRLVAEKLTSHMENQQLIRVNTTNVNQVAYLTDGSSVILKAGASIKHDAFLLHSQREVYLKGDAFFDIAKDAARPFLVYTPEVGIRVLGTSFNVSENNGDLTVTVKTGKIAVYNLADKQQHTYIVTPNHQIRFNARTAAFIADSLDNRQLAAIQPIAEVQPFVFDNTPVTTIFSALEAAYSIKINVNEEVFAKCMITTTITNESFEDKLKIICAAINAGYTIREGQVYITGKPCS
ncbi:FecR family protein [Chitinophaga sp.]|uniref:FecR family protein n=1 Tax=Chitinophaga sp. TaxID=1869181 RepID=UPI002F92470B